MSFGPYLFFTWREHWSDGQTNRLHRHGRTPIFGENGETDMPVTVDVWVDGNVFPGKHHLGGIEWILGTELEPEHERLPFVQGSVGTNHVDTNPKKAGVELGFWIKKIPSPFYGLISGCETYCDKSLPSRVSWETVIPSGGSFMMAINSFCSRFCNDKKQTHDYFKSGLK